MFTKKSILVMFVVMLLVAGMLSACQPAKADEFLEISDKIAVYTIPSEYKAGFSVDLLGYQLVNLQGPVESCHIYLVQAPDVADVDMEELQRQAENLDGSKGQDRYSRMEVVETRTVSLRGEDVPLVVSEGTNGEGIAFRSVMALFEGRGGPALVNLSAPLTEWDWDMVDRFLASIE